MSRLRLRADDHWMPRLDGQVALITGGSKGLGRATALADVVAVDLVAPFRLTQAVIGDMLRRRRGVIVNISSDAAVTPYAGWGAYAISKSGIDAMTRIWAVELADSGVRMYSLDPGDMDTAMHRAALPEDDPASLLDPTTVAPAIVDLVTGAV